MSFQTPGGPAAKRRRIEAANATLRKPFRSPLISRQQHHQNQDHCTSLPADSESRGPGTPVPSRAPRRAADASSAASPLPASPCLSTSPITPNSSSRPPKPPSNASNIATTITTTTANNSEKAAAARQQSPLPLPVLHHQMLASHRALQSHLAAAQKQLDLVRQARRIEQASFAKRPGQEADAELRQLVGKWGAASRLAADELFELIRERVEGMGGARAWRESRRRRAMGGFFYGGDFGEGEGQVVKKKGEEEEDGEGEEGGGEREEEEDEEGEGSHFTMLMMLKSLNINPDVLGYDPVEEKWRD